MEGHIKIEKKAVDYRARSYGMIFLGPCDIDRAREWLTANGYTILDEARDYLYALAYTPGSNQCEEVVFRPFPPGSLDNEQVQPL